MRLLSLDLDRYGPFSGKRLAFEPSARLHVVLGPNEAGKSCALAAVTDLLFGTKDTRYEFLHREAGLRLGAEVVARDGRTLKFFRRRGVRNTLSDGAAKPLADDALSPFLGGLTRAVFCNAFGLDAPSLRKGAEEMLRSDGEIGATLFAAASGLRGFRAVADALKEEAAGLFTPSARKRRLNDLIRFYDEARSTARGERIGADAWRSIGAALEGSADRLRAISVRRQEIAEEANRLKRLKAAAPVLASLDLAAAGLEAFAGLPDVAETAIAELARAVQAAETAAERLSVAGTALEHAEGELQRMVADDGVQPWLDAIEALAPRSGAYDQARRDLPRVQGELDGFERELEAVAVRLGLAGAADVLARQPADAARADLNGLLASGRQALAERQRIARDLERLRDELAGLRKAHLERAAPVDPQPLRVIHEALRPILAEIGRRDALQSEVAQTASELDRAAARLRPPVGPLGGAPSLALPSRDAIAKHGEAIADAVRVRDKLLESIEAAEADAVDSAERMRSRQAGAAVPDRAQMARLRQERDGAWAGVRAAALSRHDAPQGAALLDAAAIFERTSMAADAMADSLIDDARRAADHAADARRLREAQEAAKRSSARLMAAESGIDAVRAAWRELWAPSSISPLSPPEMVEWYGRATALLDRADALAARRVNARLLAERVESVRPQLEAMADRLGLTGLGGADMRLIDERVTEGLRGLGELWSSARDGAIRIFSAEDGITSAEASLADLDERQQAFLGRWRTALASAALPPDSTFDGASAALDAWAEVPGLLRERDDRRRRVAGMRRDMEAHEAEVRRVGVAVGLASDITAGDGIRLLLRRARAAREDAAARAARIKGRDDAARLRDGARDTAVRAKAALSELMRRLALPAHDDLRVFVSRLGERARAAARLGSLRDELARTGEGVPEAELRAGLADLSVDALEGRLSLLSSEAEQLDQDGRVAHSERDRLGVERGRLESGIGSEAAVARKGAAEVEIRETARRYLVLKLGSLLLAGTIERHRAGQQDPLIVRAGALFGELTGGVYQGLDQTFDERDQPILAGKRSDGRPLVAVGNMSEGTRDQLFLALRLAYLEDFAGRAEPAPFIGDDVFASFDDRRTEYGLRAVAAIGTGVQPILFTHHESVARAAQRCLGTDADVVEIG